MQYDYNTSALTRDALPDTIHRPGKRTLRIFKYARDTRDTYADVRQVSKDIWGGERGFYIPQEDDDNSEKVDIDFIVHLGMEVRGDRFQIETRARRDGYEKPGDDGNMVNSDELKALGMVEQYGPAFDLKKAFEQLRRDIPDTALVYSDDAGQYFCEFRLLSSLGEADLNYPDKKGKVALFHTSPEHDDEAIKRSAAITTAFITALADDAIIQN